MLFITFFATFLGYASVQMQLVVPGDGHMKGWGFFIGQVAFPLLVFKTVATAKFDGVDMYTILACTLGKLTVFVLTWSGTFCAYEPDRPKGKKVLTASIFAFFTTSSNDFAMGLPVVQSLYAGEHMDVYVAVNALVNSAVLTPLAMMLLAVGASMEEPIE